MRKKYFFSTRKGGRSPPSPPLWIRHWLFIYYLLYVTVTDTFATKYVSATSIKVSEVAAIGWFLTRGRSTTRLLPLTNRLLPYNSRDHGPVEGMALFWLLQWRRHEGGEWRGPDPPLLFRPLLGLAQIRWKVFFTYRGGYPMYVYCNFYCSPAKKHGSDPPLFWGWRRHWTSRLFCVNGVLAFRLFRIRLFRVRLFRIRLFRISLFRVRLFRVRLFRIRLFRIRLFRIRLFRVRLFRVHLFRVRLFRVRLFRVRLFRICLNRVCRLQPTKPRITSISLSCF